MALPVRTLPVLQHWECQGCGNCCREYEISITEDERQRIEDQGWSNHPALFGHPLFARPSRRLGSSRGYLLNHREDGACVFLNDQGRCRIHEAFGPEAKPLACRLYPFILIPAGDHWRIGLRYACPAAARDAGNPLADYKAELTGFLEGLERRLGRDPAGVSPPPLQKGQRVEWRALLQFVQGFISLLGNGADRFERRMRKCLALTRLCREARFDQVKGRRLVEFLNLVAVSVEAEVPRDPGELSPPSWMGRLLFRQAAALYARKDHGPDHSLVSHSRLALFGAACRFACGSGTVPRLHGRIPERTFDQGEHPGRPLSEGAERVLERYYSVKVGSLQFCGATNFGMPLWEGFESLALTLPIILWLTRLFAPMDDEPAVTQAVNIVDNNFGFNRLLGSSRQRFSGRFLTRRGETARLIAWYSRSDSPTP